MSYRQDQIAAHELRANNVFKLGRGHALTLAGNVTVVDDDPPILTYDAGGSSRNVTLPARADVNDGVIRLVNNISTAGENLVIKNSAATTLLTLPSGGVALVFASVLDETPGTRAWRAVPIGGEDLAIADALTVTGAATFNGLTTFGGQPDFTSSTATCTSNAATITTWQAVITTESLTTAHTASQAIVITKTGVASGDIALISQMGGSNTQGVPVFKAVCTTNTVTITIVNQAIATNAFNGTFVFALCIFKA